MGAEHKNQPKAIGAWITYDWPWVFVFVRQVTGSARLAILSISRFFVAGGALFRTIDIEKGRRDR